MSRGLSQLSVVAASEEVVSCDLAGGAALLDLRSSTYFTLNDVGSRVWELIREPKAVSAVRDGLLARYSVEPTQCYDDLVALLEQMADAGLITVTQTTHPSVPGT